MADSGLIRSPLAARLKRHTSLATLLRPAALIAPSSPVQSETGDSYSPRSPVMARPLSAAFFASQAGPETAAPPVLGAGSLPSSLDLPRITSPLSSPAKSAGPIQAASSAPATPQAPAQKLAAPDAQPRLPKAAPPAGHEDRAWNRLSAIFKRHTEQESAEPLEAQPDQTPAAQQEPPAAPKAPEHPSEHPAIRRKADLSAQPEVSARAARGTERSLEPEENAPHPDHGEPISAGGAKTIADGVAPEAETSDQEPQNREGEPLTKTPAPRRTPAREVSARPGPKPVQRSVERPNAGPSGADEAQQTQPSPGRAESEAPSSPVEPPTAEESGPVDQPLPLEAVWPVRRKEEPADSQPDRPTRAPVEIEPPLRVTPPVSRLSQALAEVKPGQPTESAIEFVPPRKARPQTEAQQLRRKGAAPEHEESGPLTEIEPTAGPVEPQAQLSKETSAVLPEESASPSSSAPALMRQVEGAPGEKTASGLPAQSHALVQTEIGALPADLWELIGEKAPQPEPAAPSTPMIQRSEEEPGGQAHLGARREQGQRLPGASQAAPEPPADSAIQRAVNIDEVSVEPASAQAGPASAQPGTAQPPAEPRSGGPNIEELARQVYAEIRRRLSIEREWYRGD